MEDCLGYVIGGILAVVAIGFLIYLLFVYVIIPCFAAVLAVCFVLGVGTGLCHTAFNYIEAINEVAAKQR